MRACLLNVFRETCTRFQLFKFTTSNGFQIERITYRDGELSMTAWTANGRWIQAWESYSDVLIQRRLNGSETVRAENKMPFTYRDGYAENGSDWAEDIILSTCMDDWAEKKCEDNWTVNGGGRAEDTWMFPCKDDWTKSASGRAKDIILFTCKDGCAEDETRQVEDTVLFTYRDGWALGGSEQT